VACLGIEFSQLEGIPVKINQRLYPGRGNGHLIQGNPRY
jgi:hypothetical protein